MFVRSLILAGLFTGISTTDALLPHGLLVAALLFGTQFALIYGLARSAVRKAENDMLALRQQILEEEQSRRRPASAHDQLMRR